MKVSLDLLLNQKNWTTIYFSKSYIPKHISMAHMDQHCWTPNQKCYQKSTLLEPINTHSKVRLLLDNWSNALIFSCIQTFSCSEIFSYYLPVYVAPAALTWLCSRHTFFSFLFTSQWTPHVLSLKTCSASAKGCFDAHFTGGDTA